MVRAEYIKTVETAEAEISRLGRGMHLLGTIRLALVVGLIALWISFGDSGWELPTAVSVPVVAAFVWLMVRHDRLSARRERAEALRELCENEIRALDNDFSAFDGAPDMAAAAHPFNLDLDIFGERSLFQSLNRTVTPAGRACLAGWFNEPLTDRGEILRRQRAVRELSERLELRQNFHVTGKLRKGGGDVTLAAPPAFTKSRFWRVAVCAVPALWVALGALYAAGLVHLGALGVFLLVSGVMANCKLKEINRLHNATDRASAALGSYSRLMEMAERTDLSSELAADVKARLTSGNETASRAIERLSKKLGTLDQRANMFVAILNVFVLWDIRGAIGVARWQERHSADVGAWFDALGEFDALCSLAGFAYNHPEYTWPEIAEGYFQLSGRGLGHPLMNAETCVRNDVAIDRNPRFMVVTGANMAGKSTFLRTVGTNFVLACVGAPVCAVRMSISPCGLVTSLRTSDSLADGESYFFAELKRLKMVMDRLRGGEKLFIVLDEILKGTNSADKQRGSLGLLRGLVSLGACGIIATHDLALAALHDEFPDSVENHRFEADIAGDALSFSYKLQAGVAENMNASLLMRRMGIIV